MPELPALMRSIAAGDDAAVAAMLAGRPDLARTCLGHGATRAESKPFFLDAIRHHVYAGDTALHVAAAAHRPALVRQLIGLGADPHARNRRGAHPLHYAADGIPGEPGWDPEAQAACVTGLLEAGADPNAVDRGGVTPLHRAVRNRCAAAVAALLAGGADPRRPNGNGSTPALLARLTTGRGGVGSAPAKAGQAEILRLLAAHGV